MASSLAGSFGFGGKKIPGYRQRTLSTLSPEQQQLFSTLFGGAQPGIQAGLGNLSQLAAGDQSQFEQLEAPALRQFGALQGGLASRFSGMGTGARRSSGFGLASSSAAQQLAESLQSQRMGLQQNAIRDLLGIGQSLLGRQTQENLLVPRQQSAGQQFLSGLGGIGGQLGGLFGGRLLGLY